MTYINTDALSDLSWASRLGASSPRAISLRGTILPVSASGTAVSGTAVNGTAASGTAASGTAASGTGPCTAVAVPRVKGEVSFVALPKQPDGVASLLPKTNIHNYMTRAYAAGEGASGPPPREDPV